MLLGNYAHPLLPVLNEDLCTTMLSGSKLEVDLFEVPQHSGDLDLFEEYCERAWDLWHAKEGNDQTRIATRHHLRRAFWISGAAHEAVRKIFLQGPHDQ